MRIAIPKETHKGETRVPLIPDHAEKLVKMGAVVSIESGLGLSCGFSDSEYKKAGASVAKDKKKLLSNADMVLRLRKPSLADIAILKKGSVHISYLDPFNEAGLIKKFVSKGVSAISIEMVPRTTRAQKLDAISSQANIAGYASVIIAAERIDKIFPMMMTPAGTINPAKVFVIGAGVAGLQAIATAKRLGARVEAFDTRPVVEEQVQSLGAKFVKVDLGETGQTKNGYAKALTAKQIEKQRKVMAKHCAMADVVITTAQIFGRKAPLIVTKDMIKGMKPGSVIVDLAVESGGNAAGVQPDKEILINGVKIVGIQNIPGFFALDASRMYSSNIFNLVEEFWDKEKKAFILDTEDEIINGCLITHDKKIVNERFKPSKRAK